jgi:RNA polymerase sigma factor (sigma-70 family)
MTGPPVEPPLREWFEQSIVGLLPDLHATALRFTRNDADAEDLVADAVTRAWEHLPGLSDRAHFRGWIFRILTNSWISECRARRSHPVQEPLSEQADDPRPRRTPPPRKSSRLAERAGRAQRVAAGRGVTHERG